MRLVRTPCSTPRAAARSKPQARIHSARIPRTPSARPVILLWPELVRTQLPVRINCAPQLARYTRSYSTQDSTGSSDPASRIKVYPNGDRYEGDFKDGRPSGQGTFKGADGSTYIGEFKNGKPDGFGVMSYSGGEEYRGEFVAGERSGKGLYRYTANDTYDGEWRTGQRHGEGTYRTADGSTYIGQWMNDRKHGKGILTIAAEDTKTPHNGRYEGEWRHGHRHGQGTYEYANGDRYVGQWERGQQHGKGTLFGHDGSKRDSSWRNGVQHGQGVYIDADGKAFKAMWENGKGYIEAPLSEPATPRKSAAPTAATPKKPLTFADISADLQPKSNAEVSQAQAGKEEDANEYEQVKETPAGLEVPEDVYYEAETIKELSKDARIQSMLKDEELKAKLRAWNKGEISEDELQADPRMQELMGFVQGELKKKEK